MLVNEPTPVTLLNKEVFDVKLTSKEGNHVVFTAYSYADALKRIESTRAFMDVHKIEFTRVA